MNEHSNYQERSIPTFVEDSIEIPALTVIQTLGEALRTRNEALIWEVARNTPSQGLFFNELLNQVGFSTYELGNRPRNHRQYCTLLMMPVILPAHAAALVDDPGVLSRVIKALHPWISEWYDGVGLTMYNTLSGYEEIASWTPSIMRERLEHLTTGVKPKLINPADYPIGLPEIAPRLAYVVLASQQPLEFPGQPELSPVKDATLLAQVSGFLDVHSPTEAGPRVRALLPDLASRSIADGLVAWITALQTELGIGAWDANPVSQNTVILELGLGDEGHTCQLPLHAHQIGLDGVDRVLSCVSAAAHAMGQNPRKPIH